ncbi:unnamed protein product [Trichobilharzia szidati]|nr:unnamed protein product [Trichobilharzia szidati]
MLKSLLKDPVLDLKRINNNVSKLIKTDKSEKKFFKLMVKTWSEDEDSRRILAFLNIMKAISLKGECTSLCIKLMYMAYVRNCKFVLGSNIAQINLMRECLLELFGTKLDEAYIHAFVYVRQLAITLRKAYSSNSKEDIQSVNNWQFVYSLYLWSDFTSRYAGSHTLVQTLIHPLTQLIYGTIKLNKGQRWIPLRFHCISMLHNLAGVPIPCEPTASEDKQQSSTDDTALKLPLVGRALSSETRLLIPTLSLLLDVFQLVNFNQRAGRVSNAPLDLRLLLHFSPSQKHETASNDAIISWLFDLLAECMALHANSIAFPEYSLPFITEVKQFLRVCRVASFCRQMKALMLKVREHSEWIVKCRRRVRNLTSKNEVRNVESTCTLFDNTNKLLPFWQFYLQHKQIRSTELNRLTESNKKEPIPTDTTTEYDSMKTKSESDDSDSDHSDSSYDIDDGRTVTHVSKSKGKKKAKKDGQVGISGDKAAQDKANNDESEESDFDLEAALMDEDDNDNKSEITGAPDELSEFELEGDSSDEYSDEKDSFTTDFDGDDNEDSDVEMTDLTKSSKPSVNRKKKTSVAVKKKVKTNNHVVPKKPIPKGKRVSATSKSQQPAIKHSDPTKTQSLVKDKKKKAKKRPIVDK